MAPPERILWSRLRNRQLRGLKFRRQHPIGRCVADFFCEDAALVVEIDGEVHATRRQHDAARDAWLNAQGLRVLRVLASDVSKDVEAVLLAILREVERCARQ
jgi:very-short-patch-repair endonuclease